MFLDGDEKLEYGLKHILSETNQRGFYRNKALIIANNY
jgi:hypothetical protein